MRTLFRACGAFLGRIDGETRCAFWVDEPTDHGFDRSLLIDVDLSRTPSAALAGELAWNEIDCDDASIGPGGSLAGTTLGARWPEMQLVGSVYLADPFIARLTERVRPPCPVRGMHGQPHEHTAVLYWPGTGDPRAGRRYHGHHARIVEQRGTLAHLEVFAPGQSDVEDAKPHRIWIDLSSPDQCDAGADALTTVGGDRREGAVFLITGQIDE